MIEWVSLTMTGVEGLRSRPTWNYRLIERAGETAARCGVTVLAFGIGGATLQLLLAGDAKARGNQLRGLKVGTIRAAQAIGAPLRFVETERREIDGDLTAVVVATHRLPMDHGARGPLESPWSSHRDLLGYRRASFFDVGPLRARVDPALVHRRLGGGRDPARPRREPPPPTLELLLRTSAAVRGTVAADPKCYAAFVQAAKARGFPTQEIARSLAVTPRRVNQLARCPDPYLPLVERTLADPRLRRVP